MSKTTLFGISNCDTIKKAKKWLQANEVDYQFHDYRKDGLDETLLNELETRLGWENLLNKRGTTFRKLDEQQKAGLDRQKAITLLLEHPAMIKRPVLINGQHYYLGFKPAQYEDIFHS